MSDKQRNDYRPVDGPRTHQNCKEQTGVFRPGKTAKDKAMGANRIGPNRRAYDRKTGLPE